jgi:plastocyanin
LATSTPAPAAADGVVQATIEGFGYLPEPVRIRVGGTVVWTNLDRTPHSATANDGSFDSRLLGLGESFSHTFTQPGEFDYYCTRHGGMAGRVVVEP